MPENYQNAAKVLDELLLALIKNGAAVPGHVVDDLKAGRAYSKVALRDPNNTEIAMKAVAALQNVEMNLLALAQEMNGVGYADEWQRKISAAYAEEYAPAASESASKFLPGLPKGVHWVRIKASELETVDAWETLLAGYPLSVEAQDDGYRLIYGRKEDVSAFLSEIRKIIRKNGETE